MTWLDTLGQVGSFLGDFTGLDDAWHDMSLAFTDAGEDDSVFMDLGQALRGAGRVVTSPLHIAGESVMGGLNTLAAGAHYATSAVSYAQGLTREGDQGILNQAARFLVMPGGGSPAGLLASGLNAFAGPSKDESWSRPDESGTDYRNRLFDATIGGNWDNGLSVGEMTVTNALGASTVAAMAGISTTNPLDWSTLERDKAFRSDGAPLKFASGTTDLVYGTVLDPANLLPGAGKLARLGIAGKHITVGSPSKLRGAFEISQEKVLQSMEEGLSGNTGVSNHFDWLAEQDATTILKSPEARRSGDAATFAHLMGQASSREEVFHTYRILGRLGDDTALQESRDFLVQAHAARGGNPLEADYILDSAINGLPGPRVANDIEMIDDATELDRLQAIFTSVATDPNRSLARAYEQKLDQLVSERVSVVSRAPGTNAFLRWNERVATKRANRGGYAAPQVTVEQPTRHHPVMAVVNVGRKTADFFTKPRTSGYLSVHDSDSVDEIAALIDDIDRETGGAMQGGLGRSYLNAYMTARGEADKMRIALAIERHGLQLIGEKYGISGELAQKLWQESWDRRSAALNQHRERGFISFLLNDTGHTGVVKIPLLERQNVNTLPLLDFREVTKAIQRHDAGLLEGIVRDGAKGVVGVADVVNDIFKMSVLFRLGYTIRNMTEAYASLFVSGHLANIVLSAGRDFAEGWTTNAGVMKNRLIDKVQVMTGKRRDISVLANDDHVANAHVRVRQQILDAVREGAISRANLRLTDAEIALLRDEPDSEAAVALREKLLNIARLRAETTRTTTYHATDNPDFRDIDGDWIDTTPSSGVAGARADGIHTVISWETANNNMSFGMATKQVRNDAAFAQPMFDGPGFHAVQHGTRNYGIEEGLDPDLVRQSDLLIGGGLYTTDSRPVAHGYVSSDHFNPADGKKQWDEYDKTLNPDWGDGYPGDAGVFEIKWDSRTPPKVFKLEDAILPGQGFKVREEVGNGMIDAIPTPEVLSEAIDASLPGLSDEQFMLVREALEMAFAHHSGTITDLKNEIARIADYIPKRYVGDGAEYWDELATNAEKLWSQFFRRGMEPGLGGQIRTKFVDILRANDPSIDAQDAFNAFNSAWMNNSPWDQFNLSADGKTWLNDHILRDKLGYDAIHHVGGLRWNPGGAPKPHNVYVWITDDPSKVAVRRLDRNKTNSVRDEDRIQRGYSKMLDDAQTAAEAGKVVEIRRGSTWRRISAERIEQLRMRRFQAGDERAIIRYRDPDKKPGVVEVPSYGDDLDLTNLANWPDDLKELLGVTRRAPQREPQPRFTNPSKFFNLGYMSPQLADQVRRTFKAQYRAGTHRLYKRDDLPAPIREYLDTNQRIIDNKIIDEPGWAKGAVHVRLLRDADGNLHFDPAQSPFLRPGLHNQPHVFIEIASDGFDPATLGNKAMVSEADMPKHVWEVGEFKPAKRRRKTTGESHREWAKREAWNDEDTAQKLADYARENGFGRIVLPSKEWGKTVRVLKDNVEGRGGRGATPVVERNVDRLIAEAMENGGEVSALRPSSFIEDNRAARRKLRQQRRLTTSERQRLVGRPVRLGYAEERVQAMLDNGIEDAIRQATEDLARSKAWAEQTRTALADGLNRQEAMRLKTRVGEKDHVVQTEFGPVTVPGAFAGRAGGVMFQRTHGDANYEALIGDGHEILSRAMNQSVPVAVRPEDPRYFEAWSNILNWHWRDPDTGRIDPLVERLMASDRDTRSVKDWLTTREGRAYADQFGWSDIQAEAAVDQLNQSLDLYLPTNELIDIWRAGQLDAGKLSEVFGGRTDLPELNGLLVPQSLEYAESNSASRLVRRGARGMFHLLGALPETAWARHPLFRTYVDNEMRRVIPQAAKAKGAPLTNDEVNDILTRVQERGRKVVNETLFTINRRTGASQNLRLIAPFYAAWENVIKRWGNFAVKNTERVLLGASRVNRFVNNAILVNTETGEEAKWGETPFDSTAMVMPFKLDGWDLRVPLASLDVIFQGNPANPGIGPFVALPLIKVMESQPKAEQILEWAFPVGIPREATDVFLSASLRRLKSRITQDQSYVNDANRIAQMEYIRYTRGERTDLPTWSEIQDKTNKFYGLRMWTNLLAPASPSYVNDVNYYAEELRRYKAAYGEDDGELRFLEDRPEAFVVLQSLSENRSGARATYESVDNLKKYGDLAAEAEALGDDQMLGWLANFGQGEYDPAKFSEAAYNWQLANSPVPGAEAYRKRKNPMQIYTDAQVYRGWVQYRGMIDVIESKIAGMGYDLSDAAVQSIVKDLRGDIATAIGSTNDQWKMDYVTTDRAKFERRAEFFDTVLSDEGFVKDNADDPTLRYISTFLDLRSQMQGELGDRIAAGGAKTLTANANADLLYSYDTRIAQMKAESVGFADWYERYFSNDPVVL